MSCNLIHCLPDFCDLNQSNFSQSLATSTFVKQTSQRKTKRKRRKNTKKQKSKEIGKSLEDKPKLSISICMRIRYINSIQYKMRMRMNCFHSIVPSVSVQIDRSKPYLNFSIPRILPTKLCFYCSPGKPKNDEDEDDDGGGGASKCTLDHRRNISQDARFECVWGRTKTEEYQAEN